MKTVVKIEKLNKSYTTDKEKLHVLEDINVEFEKGKFYAIMGHSGSGKSTLINILGLVDEFDTGNYVLYEKNIKNLSDKELSALRMNNIGFIFQEFYLNYTLKAYENVIIPMLINRKINIKNRKDKANELLRLVGLEHRVNHFPKQLSGGEQQRVAIARSLANDPTIILADEPTGNLDEKNEKHVFKILKDISEQDKCVILVTHSNEVKKYADEIYKIKNGKLTKNEI